MRKTSQARVAAMLQHNAVACGFPHRDLTLLRSEVAPDGLYLAPDVAILAPKVAI
jgi:hypothetical protein